MRDNISDFCPSLRDDFANKRGIEEMKAGKASSIHEIRKCRYERRRASRRTGLEEGGYFRLEITL